MDCITINGFYDVLNYIRQNANTQFGKRRLFERLVRAYLLEDPLKSGFHREMTYHKYQLLYHKLFYLHYLVRFNMSRLSHSMPQIQNYTLFEDDNLTREL